MKKEIKNKKLYFVCFYDYTGSKLYWMNTSKFGDEWTYKKENAKQFSEKEIKKIFNYKNSQQPKRYFYEEAN